MTTRAQNVLNFIRTYHARHGYAPSRREIGRGCHVLSISNVNGLLTKLVREGRLEITAGVARGIKLVEDAPDDADWQYLNAIALRQALRQAQDATQDTTRQP